jgi:Putative Actinobacterial Holin-X, holin superfamily III
VSRDFSQLVSTQVQLAKVEIQEEIAAAGRGAGILAGGAFCAYLAVVLLSFAAAWGLSEIMPEGLAFLVVGAVYAVAAAVLLPKGKNKLSQVRPIPEKSAETVREDVQWAREQMS